MRKLHLKCNRNNVPVLSNREIDDVIGTILRDYNPRLLTDPQPLNVEDFVECYLGLHTCYADLSHSGCVLGMMVFVDGPVYLYDKERREVYEELVKANTVLIDSGLSSNREHALRSTFGHEGVHYIIHPDYYICNFRQHRFPLGHEEKQMDDQPRMDEKTGGFSFCCKRHVLCERDEPKKLKTDKDWIEHQAKYGSASALMPEAAMKIVMSDLNSLPEDTLAAEVSKIFNVSLKSAKYRIKDLRKVHADSQPLRQIELF